MMLCQSTTGVGCVTCMTYRTARSAAVLPANVHHSAVSVSEITAVNPVTVLGQGSTQHLYNLGLTISSPYRP
jgi:hypothetical protein